MDKLKELLASRKFWALLVGLVFDIIAWAKGAVSSEVAMAGVVALIGLWQQAQAKVDANKV